MRLTPFLPILLLSVVFFVSCEKSHGPAQTASETSNAAYYDRQAFLLSLNSNFIMYDTIMKLTGVIDTLERPGPYTTFVPDNNSVNQTGWGYYGNSIAWIGPPPNGGAVLTSLIFPGAHYLDTLTVGRNQVWTAVNGVPAYVSKYVNQGDTLYAINGTQVTTPDFPASNGPIEVMDAGIPNVQNYSTVTAYVNSAIDLTFLAVVLERSGYDRILSDSSTVWTLLAPNNSAFQYALDPSLNSIDSLLVADTAKLGNLVRLHLLAGRQFIFDLNLQAGALGNGSTGATDSIRLYGLNGWAYDYINNGGRPEFLAPGDTAWQYSWQAGMYEWLPSPASLNYQDHPVGNGVIHEINEVLAP